MNNLRISEKNKINVEIKSTEVAIKRNSTTIERLSSQPYSEFNKLQIQKLLFIKYELIRKQNSFAVTTLKAEGY